MTAILLPIQFSKARKWNFEREERGDRGGVILVLYKYTVEEIRANPDRERERLLLLPSVTGFALLFGCRRRNSSSSNSNKWLRFLLSKTQGFTSQRCCCCCSNFPGKLRAKRVYIYIQARVHKILRERGERESLGSTTIYSLLGSLKLPCR